MKFISAVFLLSFCFLSENTGAQKCNCPEYYTMKAEWESSEAESKPFVEKLQSSSNKICVAKSYEWLAGEYLDAGSFDTSDIYFQKAESLFKKSNCSDSILLTTYKKWAQLYYTKADFAKAQDYTFKLLKAAESAESPHEIGVCYTMIAQLFNQTGQAEKGIIYTRLAVPFVKKIDTLQKAADLLFKLSKRYLWHYQDTKTKSSLDSSELFSYQQLEIARKLNRSSSIAAVFSNLEGIAWERGDLKKALLFLDSSFKYADSNDFDNLGTNYYDKADILIELKRYTEAKQMADSALHYRKLNGNPAYIAELYESIFAKIAEETGDYKNAYDYKEAGRVITDSIKNVEKAKQVAELEKKYNQAKNEKTIKELAQQKRIYLLLALAGLLGLCLFAVYIRQQLLKNKQKILETEQRLNRARINPHFFFNALSSLQTFALQGSDGKTMAGNLSKFSHIMRETLESTYKEYVTLEQEKDFLTEYLELQKMRFPQKFTYEIKINDDLDADRIMIPSMILQPFVENSIEHGFTGINYPGQAGIQFSKEAKGLLITISDNGKGLANPAKENSEHISRASQIIKDRIYLLNMKLKTKAGFSLDNNPDGKGVSVKIHLPVLNKKDIK
jgi:tetratricopeptide (TPR) repeat protein